MPGPLGMTQQSPTPKHSELSGQVQPHSPGHICTDIFTTWSLKQKAGQGPGPGVRGNSLRGHGLASHCRPIYSLPLEVKPHRPGMDLALQGRKRLGAQAELEKAEEMLGSFSNS